MPPGARRKAVLTGSFSILSHMYQPTTLRELRSDQTVSYNY